MSQDITVASGPLERAIAAIVSAGGSNEAEAKEVAVSLVQANLFGHDSHGVGMIPRYVESLQEGGLKPNQQPRIVLDIGTLLTLDGQGGYGQTIGRTAMKLGIERARRHGSCIMALGNAHHLARIGRYAEQAVAEGLVSIHFVNVMSRPIVAAWGGGAGRFGTNPCCIGVPVAGADPFVLDFATSVVAQGKMRVATNKGERVPAGRLIDDKGAPTTDPKFVVKPPYGALMPFGEHKGSGLALACELLGGALTGGGTWRHDYKGERRVLNGMLTILIDPARIGSGVVFEQEVTGFLEWLRQAPAAEGFDRMRVAGEPERETRARRLTAGIPIDVTTWREILAAGEKIGVSAASTRAAAQIGDAP